MDFTTPAGLHIAGCWTKAGMASCVHVRGSHRSEDLLFDCGVVEQSTFSAGHVLCTHGHIDHIGAVVSHARARALTHEPAVYYMPKNCQGPILEVKAAFEKLDGREIPMVVRTVGPGDWIRLCPTLKVYVFPTSHRVPSQGYAVYSLSNSKKLREEYCGLDRLQIKELIHSGVNIYEESSHDLQICYTGDTVMSGLLSYENTFIFHAPILIMELTYLDGDPSKAVQWGHIHINDVVEHAETFQNQRIVFVHLSAKYNPYGRAIHLLRQRLPPALLEVAAVSLFSFGSGEHLTRLNLSFAEEERQVGWGWGRDRSSGGRRVEQVSGGRPSGGSLDSYTARRSNKRGMAVESAAYESRDFTI